MVTTRSSSAGTAVAAIVPTTTRATRATRGSTTEIMASSRPKRASSSSSEDVIVAAKKTKAEKPTGRRSRQSLSGGISGSSSGSSAANDDASTRPLLDLGPLEEGVLVRRPSERNRSPYVGDVRITSGPNVGSVALTHLPNLDSGGKCRPGVRLLCRRVPGVGPDTVGGKFGTPKCELICQLIRCDEAENAGMGGCWVSAHPTIGEGLVEALVRRGAFDSRLHAPVVELETQVTKARRVTESDSGGYRPDFRAIHADGTSTLIETKQVVDTDYDPVTAEDAARAQPGHPVYARRDGIAPSGRTTGVDGGYQRAGIFPWGKRGQRGPDGELVVSARAIEHMRELVAIVVDGSEGDGGGRGGGGALSGDMHAALILMAGRHDVSSIRPNGKACPSFAAHLSRAEGAGVRIIGHRVRWGEGRDAGKAYDGGGVPVLSPLIEDDLAVLVPKAKRAKEARPTTISSTQETVQ